MIRLGIGLPAYGSKLDVGHAPMWLGLGAALAATADRFKLAMFSHYHVNGIDLARNTIVYDALQAGVDWVLMIDADTFHATGGGADDAIADAIADAGVDLLQMVRDADRGQYADGEARLRPIAGIAQANGIGLIGAPVRGRGVGDNGICVQGLAGTGPLTIEQVTNRVQAVGRIGGACIAVNCGWLRQHWAAGPWFVMEHDYTGRPRNARGEDYTVCDGIIARGGAVVCDGRFVPAHVDRRKLVGE
jgi:hypothetical protein